MSFSHGAHPSPFDPRDLIAKATLVGVAAPQLATLRPYADKVARKSQGGQGACTGFSLSYARELMEVAHGKPYERKAAAFIYAEERIVEHDLNADAGAFPRDGLNVLRKRGVCREAAMPFDDAVFAVAPTPAQRADAAPFRITRYGRLHTVEQAAAALAGGDPVVLGVMVTQAFEDAARAGDVVPPVGGATVIGGHCILLYEIDRQKGEGAAMSNWLTPDHHLSLAFLADPHSCFEMWSVE